MQGNLDTVIAMIQLQKVYHGNDGAKAGGSGRKGSRNIKNRKRETWHKSRGPRLGGLFMSSRSSERSQRGQG